MSIVFCNVGWMERYQGQGGNDKIKGGGGYVLANGMGHEILNFHADRGTVFGFAQAPGQGIDVERLGAAKGATELKDVTVVWTATRPKGKTVVVGWYRNATVYRSYQKHVTQPAAQAGSGITDYLVKAAASDATLLPVDARVLQVPRQQKGGMGQSNVWYADAPESRVFVRSVEALLKTGAVAPTSPKKTRQKPDQARKVLVEKTAIALCWRHYESLGYDLENVESDNVGWDLEATKDKVELRIEVKGLSGKGRQVELSPNEYDAFDAKAFDYRLAVVSNALEQPKLTVVRYSEEQAAWVVDDDDRAVVTPEPKTGAVVRIRP